MSDLFTPTVARTASAYAAAGINTYTSDSTTGTSKTDSKNNAGYLTDSSKDNLTLTMEQFLQLMIVQFQNQDMDNPASTSDMMNQLMQMSNIQAMATMTDASTMTYAASLVGKTVTIGEYTKDGLKEYVGEVTGTGTYDGEQVIFVNGKTYPITSIMAIGEIPKKDEVDPDFSVDPPENGDNTEDTGGTEGTEGTGGTEDNTDNTTESGEG